LTELPAALGQLDKLEVLTASQNKIRKIPRSLYSLGPRLVMLQLNDNKIKRLSKGVSQLTKLKILLIHNNQLAQVPSEICLLSEINEFSLEWFQYMDPPMSKILKDERGLIIFRDF